MPFDPTSYGPEVAAILRLDGDGARLMPLLCGAPVERARAALAGRAAADLFPEAPHPAGAMAGLWAYFSHFDAAHEIAQGDPSAEGSLWHAILHRREPDDFNAGYWFRRAGPSHPIFDPLAAEAARIAARHPGCGLPRETRWDPGAFISYCAAARASPGSPRERAALEAQRVEWQLLFHHCALKDHIA